MQVLKQNRKRKIEQKHIKCRNAKRLLLLTVSVYSDFIGYTAVTVNNIRIPQFLDFLTLDDTVDSLLWKWGI